MANYIDRQTAIDLLKQMRKDGDMIPWEGKDVFARIRKLPPAEPKRGRWIKLDMHRGMADHKCSACEQECYVPTCMGEPMYAFCPNCGSYNGGEYEI